MEKQIFIFNPTSGNGKSIKFIKNLVEEVKKNYKEGITNSTWLSEETKTKALEKLAGLSNIEIRMYQTDEKQGGFHRKGQQKEVDIPAYTHNVRQGTCD